jgi:hypothetical protein
MEKQIPILRVVDGFVLGYVDASVVLLNQGNYRPVFNRKGYLPGDKRLLPSSVA